MGDKLLNSINDAIDRLSIGRGTIYRLINEGHLKTVKFGGRRFVREEDLKACADWMASQNEAA